MNSWFSLELAAHCLIFVYNYRKRRLYFVVSSYCYCSTTPKTSRMLKGYLSVLLMMWNFIMISKYKGTHLNIHIIIRFTIVKNKFVFQEHGNNTVVYFNAVTNKDNWANVYSPSFTAELRCSYSNEFNSTDSNDTTSATITAWVPFCLLAQSYFTRISKQTHFIYFISRTILIVNPSTGNGDLKVTLSLLKDDAPLQTTDELRVGDLIQIKVNE